LVGVPLENLGMPSPFNPLSERLMAQEGSIPGASIKATEGAGAGVRWN
jgi:hypothetical protein